MKVIFFLILASLVVAIGFSSHSFAVKDGQFDDDYTPSVRFYLTIKSLNQKNLITIIT
ncbi:MAG: cbb3-type cytochrome oxidase assembly protein [Saprospiraceae bacterium]